EALAVLGLDVAHVELEAGNVARRLAEVAAAGKDNVAACHLLSALQQPRHPHRPEVAAVARHQYPHGTSDRIYSTTLRPWNASAKPSGALHSTPRRRIRPRKVSGVNQARVRWLPKCCSRALTLASASLRERGR